MINIIIIIDIFLCYDYHALVIIFNNGINYIPYTGININGINHSCYHLNHMISCRIKGVILDPKSSY